jgi:hypothetical protein
MEFLQGKSHLSMSVISMSKNMRPKSSGGSFRISILKAACKQTSQLELLALEVHILRYTQTQIEHTRFRICGRGKEEITYS